MNDLDKQHLGLQLVVGVVKAMKLDPKTKHLIPLTPKHRRVWIENMEEMITMLQDQIEVSRKELENG
jgi:hypothetical protein